MNRRFWKYLFFFGCLSIGSAADRPAGFAILRPDETRVYDLQIAQLDEGVYEIRTTGTDPYFYTLPFAESGLADTLHVLSFEYLSTAAAALQIFFAPSPTETGSIFSSLSAAEVWTGHAVDLQESGAWKDGVRFLRLDFGGEAGRIFQIRNLRLRPPTSPERRAAQERSLENQARLLLENGIRAYLKNTYPCRIHNVTVETDTIRIEGTLGAGRDNLYLCEALPQQVLFDRSSQNGLLQRCLHVPPSSHKFEYFLPLTDPNETFDVRVPRFVWQKGVRRDRLFSKWAVGQDAGYHDRRFQLFSHARWADAFPCRGKRQEEKPKSKKGLGALWLDRPLEDLDELGIGCVTVNIVLNRLISPANKMDSISYELNGKTYSFQAAYVDGLDRVLREAAERDLIVAAILLVQKDPRGGGVGNPAGFLAHPKSEESAVYAMPNFVQPEGIEYYQAVLDFLAARYGRDDRRYGRIHHWILHNEIDMGYHWTSAGPVGPLTYMDLYQKSMRMAFLTARKYNPHAGVFLSLTHHWNRTSHLDRGYLPRRLLEILLDQCGAEGDFPWAIAYHPYPQSLVEPKTWLDSRVSHSFETPLITPKNIEVLDAWVRQKRTFYRGQTPRTVWLSEQGLNSRDYSETSLAEQAAGMAYVWKKIKPLESIEAFVYHNWVDNEQEDGLLIGLRKLPAEGRDRKPIWYVYRDLETPEEEAACDFAKDLIGIEDWDQVRYTEPILETNLIEY